MIKSTQLSWVNYYRNSLADGEMLDIKTKDCKDGYFFDRLSELTSKNLKEVYNSFKKSNGKPNAKFNDEEDLFPINVFISPFYIDSEHIHGKRKDNYKRIYPFWIPGMLTSNGLLNISAEENMLPWFMRSVLEPVYSESGYYPILSSVELVDQVLNSFNYCFNSWDEYWKSSESFFEKVTDKNYSSFALEGFNTVNKICIIRAKRVVSAQNILKVYDDVLKEATIPPLMDKMLSITKDRKRAQIPEKQKLFVSKGHYAQYNNQFPLSTSQRISLMLFEQDNSGEVLAVNGPPGTGKTTILQSIVANEMVKAAIRGNEPPLIAASSTNNQAITNILDSFKSGGIIERWIPNLNSLGSYLISSDSVKQDEAQKKGYQLLKRVNNNFDGFYFNDICSLDSGEIEQFFIERFAKTYPDIKDVTIDRAVDFLKNKINEQAGQIDSTLEVISNYFEAEEEYFPLSNLPIFKKEIEQLDDNLQLQVELGIKLLAFRDRFADFAKKNRLMISFCFIILNNG